MKANELMIGDWVTTEFIGAVNIPRKVISIDHEFVVVEDDAMRIRLKLHQIKPVPLAADMLLANGFWIGKGPAFEKDKHPTYCLAENGKRNFTVITISAYNEQVGGVRFLTKVECDSRHECGINSIHSCDIEYVHQLQHAIHQCGIEKEIKLENKP